MRATVRIPNSSFQIPNSSLRLLACERLEVVVDLLLIGGGRLVVGAGGETVARVSSLQLARQFRFGAIERERHLLAQLLPLREILLERLGSWGGHHHSLTLERKADPPVLDLRIVAAVLIDQ